MLDVRLPVGPARRFTPVAHDGEGGGTPHVPSEMVDDDDASCATPMAGKNQRGRTPA